MNASLGLRVAAHLQFAKEFMHARVRPSG